MTTADWTLILTAVIVLVGAVAAVRLELGERRDEAREDAELRRAEDELGAEQLRMESTTEPLRIPRQREPYE